MSFQEDLIFSDQFEYEDHINSIPEPPTRLSDKELAELEAEANELDDYIKSLNHRADNLLNDCEYIERELERCVLNGAF